MTDQTRPKFIVLFFYEILPIACTKAYTLELYHNYRTQHSDTTGHIGLGHSHDSFHGPKASLKVSEKKKRKKENSETLLS